MKFWGNIALTLLCLAGFIVWMWRLQNGEQMTWYSVFFTVGSALGVLTFAISAMDEVKM